MTLKKQFYYSKKRMQAPDFERTLAFTSAHENTRAIARDYLVESYSLATITTKFDTTKQNVFRAVNKLMEDAQTAQDMIVKIRRVFDRLSIPKKQYAPARAFFFTSDSLDEIAQQTNSTVKDVLKAAQYTIKQHELYANNGITQDRQTLFDNILPYSRAGEKATQVCYEHFVMQNSLIEIAEKHETSKQNIYNIIKRFEEALARYEAENPPKPKRRKITKP